MKKSEPNSKPDRRPEQSVSASPPTSSRQPQAASFKFPLNWEKGEGFIPAIVQDEDSGRVLMLGLMNSAALEKTLGTGLVTFWSRSKKRLWTKGETSGHSLKLREIRHDCDADALLVLADPQGPTCHRGTVSCFGEDEPFTALEFLSCLEALIQGRKEEMPEGSYTSSLFAKGLTEIAKKLGEEAIEMIVSVGQEKERSVEEAADLLYHLLIFLTERKIALREVVNELERRHRQG